MLCKLLFFSFAAIGLVAGRATTQSRDQQFQEILRRQCKQYGTEDKVPELMVASKKFNDCVMENIGLHELSVLMLTVEENSPEAVLGVTRQLCKKKSELEMCVFNLMDALVPCMSRTRRATLDVQKSALQDLVNYTCKNNAQIISDIFEDGSLQCLESKMIYLDICIQDLKDVDLESLSTAEMCQEVSQHRRCIDKTLNECPKRTLADFVSKNFDALLKGSLCDNTDYSVTARGNTENKYEISLRM